MARPDMNSSLHETLHAAFTVQHEAARRDHSPSLRVRRERLARIKALIERAFRQRLIAWIACQRREVAICGSGMI